MNFRVMSVLLLEKISNQQGHAFNFLEKNCELAVFSHVNNHKDPFFKQASQVFRVAAHYLRPRAIR